MPEFRDEHGRFAQQPEQPAEPEQPAGPDWSALEQRGVTPEQAAEVMDRWAALNNLDTRQQALQSIYRPDVDTWLQPVQPEQPPNPFDQYFPGDEPEYEPEPQAFDPRTLQPIFDQYGNQIEERAFSRVQQWLTGMMQEQQFTDAAGAAVQSAGLPPGDAFAIEQQAKAIAQQQPHRQPGEIANELARARRAELDQWRAQSGPAPIGSPSTPAGPAPSLHKIPTTEAEAIALSREGLDG